MPATIRNRRIGELKRRAAKVNLEFHNRFNSLHCLTGTRQLGEKTQFWTQKLIFAMRDQYPGLEEQKQLDVLQERLDRQRDLLVKRQAREATAETVPEIKRRRGPRGPEITPAATDDFWGKL